MVYYTRDGKCNSYKKNIDSQMKGKQGIVYRLLDDPSVCLKEYIPEEEVDPIYREFNRHFGGDMFDYFKDEFNHPNYCKLHELLFDKKLETVLAYTMNYYQEMVENILDLPVSYLLDNYSLLYDAVVRLAMDCIMIVDMHGGNIINTDNGMIVTDYDQCIRSKDREILSYYNKQALIYAFHHMLRMAFKKKGIDVNKDVRLGLKLKEMFDLISSVSFGVSPIDLKNKLRGYTKTIDYFYTR